MDNFKTLRVTREDAVVRLLLAMPETGNVIDQLMMDELLAVLGAVHDDPGIRVLVVSGEGADFCLGGDRRELASLMAADPSGGRVSALGAKARRVYDALATSPAVTIARLHGGVIGAGLALALFCDLRAASDTARFRLPELALGLPVGWGVLPRLIQEVGAARLRELALTASSFGAATARELSVVQRVLPEEELDLALDDWIRPIARRRPGALRATKAALNAYGAAARMGDVTLLDGELMAAVLPMGRPPGGVV